MNNFNQKSQPEKIIFVLYYVVATIEVILESFSYKPLIFVFKPMIPLTLIVLYWITSKKRDPFFFVTVTLALITDVFFISNTERMLFLGLVFFFINRIIIIYYIVKLIKIKDYIPLFIAMIPFLFIFFYLLSISSETTTRALYIVIVQNILISILSGIILSHYVMFYSKNALWLFIFGLLTVTQYFIVFLEKYYLAGVSPAVFRPVAMILNTGVYFSFYKFIVANEKLHNNRFSA